MEFSHVCEMKITFTAYPRFITYEHYLEITKPMVEWVLIMELYRNSELIKNF